MRILIAEDDPDVGQLLDIVLTGFGHEVTVVADGAAAIGAFPKARFELVVLDVMMPQADGLEVTKAIRQQAKNADVPIILLTAKSSEDAHILGFEAGADAYVTKPFRPIELHEVIQQVAAKSASQRANDRKQEHARASFLRKLEHRF